MCFNSSKSKEIQTGHNIANVDYSFNGFSQKPTKEKDLDEKSKLL